MKGKRKGISAREQARRRTQSHAEWVAKNPEKAAFERHLAIARLHRYLEQRERQARLRQLWEA
jgi:hypothetical protein